MEHHTTTYNRRRDVAAALKQVHLWAMQPRALVLSETDRSALEDALERVEGQMLGEAENVLTIALVGCTGAGKSTLTNALAGSVIVPTSERRSHTKQVQVYHHQEVPRGGLPEALAAESHFVSHNRPELRHKLVVDTPDLDSFDTNNRDASRALLKHAGLVIYVCTPERYYEERAWSVLREERQFSGMAAVLNYPPGLNTGSVEAITRDLRAKFAEAGSPDVRIFRLPAICHTPDHLGVVHPLPPGAIDEFDDLRAFIELELTEGDITRMIRQQRLRVVDHLEATVDRLIPANLAASLDELDRTAEKQGKDVASTLAHELENRLMAIDDDLIPVATHRRALMFRGPLRMAMRGSEFVRYTLPRAFRRQLLLGPEAGARVDVEGRLVTNMDAKADDLLHMASGTLQQKCFDAGLPVGCWQEITAETTGTELLKQIADTLGTRLEASLVDRISHRRLAKVLSFFSVLVFVSFAGFGLVQVVQGLITFDTVAAYGALGLTAIGLVLCFLMLYGLAVFLVPVRRSIGAYDQASKAVKEITEETITGWVDSYRNEVESDVESLNRPLTLLRNVLDTRLLPVAAGEASPGDEAITASGQKALAPGSQAHEQKLIQLEDPDEDTEDNPFLEGARKARSKMQSGK